MAALMDEQSAARTLLVEKLVAQLKRNGLSYEPMTPAAIASGVGIWKAQIEEGKALRGSAWLE